MHMFDRNTYLSRSYNIYVRALWWVGLTCSIFPECVRPEMWMRTRWWPIFTHSLASQNSPIGCNSWAGVLVLECVEGGGRVGFTLTDEGAVVTNDVREEKCQLYRSHEVHISEVRRCVERERLSLNSATMGTLIGQRATCLDV